MSGLNQWQIDTDAAITKKQQELKLLEARLDERIPDWVFWIGVAILIFLGVAIWPFKPFGTDELEMLPFGVAILLLIGGGDYTSKTKKMRNRQELIAQSIEDLKNDRPKRMRKALKT